MDKEKISWSYDNYKTDDERIEEIKIAIRKLNELLEEYVVDLDTYNKQIKTLQEKVENMLIDCADNEFYYIENKYKEGTENTRRTTEGVFKTRRGLEDRIEGITEILWEDDEIDENECMWWEITKYINAEGYKNLYKIYLAADRTLLGLDFENENISLLNDSEMEVCQSFIKNFGKEKTRTVLFPYEAGDVVKIDYTPYNCKSDCLVYSGYKDYFIAADFHLTKITEYKPIVEIGKFSFPEHQLIKVLSAKDFNLRMISAFLREKPEYFKTEEHRNENSLQGFYSELFNGKLNFVPDINETLTFHEYKCCYNKFKNHSENLFASPLNDDEVYFLSLRYCGDCGIIVNDSTFENFDKLHEYILKERHERNIDEKKYWWQVERKKAFGNEYRTLMALNVSVCGEPISVSVCDFFNEMNSSMLKELVSAYQSIFAKNDKKLSEMELPFETGDIICVDIVPERNKEYVVYLGKLNFNNKQEHACLLFSGKYSVVDLMFWEGKDDGVCKIPFMNKVNNAGSHVSLERYAKIIKFHPEIVEDLLDISNTTAQTDEDEIEYYLNVYY